MPISRTVCTVIVAALFATGCSTLQFPGVYRITVDQGNIVTQEMVDQLQPGMSRSQVQFILGSPLLQHTFDGDRWDYLYTRQQGIGERHQQRLTVFFEGDRMSHLSGTFVPGGAIITGDRDDV